jgi:hypothetical protein
MLLKPDETMLHISDRILCNSIRLRCYRRGIQGLPNAGGPAGAANSLHLQAIL